MALNRILLRRYRGDSRWPTPIQYAVQQYRFENTDPKIEWLGKLDGYSDETVSGPYKGLHATVRVWHDESYMLGDDDVTGTFTDIEEPGVTIPNTGGSRNGYAFYRPSNYRLMPDGMDYPRGMAKVDKPIFKRWLLEQEMEADRDRSWIGVTVTLSLDGVELASDSLGGIDLGTDGAVAYLWECAEECLSNAAYTIDTDLLDREITSLADAADTLRALRTTITENGGHL